MSRDPALTAVFFSVSANTLYVTIGSRLLSTVLVGERHLINLLWADLGPDWEDQQRTWQDRADLWHTRLSQHRTTVMSALQLSSLKWTSLTSKKTKQSCPVPRGYRSRAAGGADALSFQLKLVSLTCKWRFYTNTVKLSPHCFVGLLRESLLQCMFHKKEETTEEPSTDIFQFIKRDMHPDTLSQIYLFENRLCCESSGIQGTQDERWRQVSQAGWRSSQPGDGKSFAKPPQELHPNLLR